MKIKNPLLEGRGLLGFGNYRAILHDAFHLLSSIKDIERYTATTCVATAGRDGKRIHVGVIDFHYYQI